MATPKEALVWAFFLGELWLRFAGYPVAILGLRESHFLR
jgi:hypothetical protein